MRFLFLAYALLAASCATAVLPISSSGMSKQQGGSTPLPDDYFVSTQMCWKEWGELVNEWIKNGGGVKNSILETRRQISTDKKSVLARMVRDTWKRQAIVYFKTFSGPTLPWPVPDSVWDAVSSASLEPALPGVSRSCGSLAWIGPTLWDHLMISKSPFPREMPDGIKSDPHEAGNWMAYWILVR